MSFGWNHLTGRIQERAPSPFLRITARSAVQERQAAAAEYWCWVAVVCGVESRAHRSGGRAPPECADRKPKLLTSDQISVTINIVA